MSDNEIVTPPPSAIHADIPHSSTISAVIIRADGTVVDLGIVSAAYRSRWKELKWRLLGQHKAAYRTRKANKSVTTI